VELPARRADRLAHERPPETADEVLLAAVRRLPERQRAATGLRYGADLDLQAVGATLGVSVAAAGMLIRRALDRLRAELSREEITPSPVNAWAASRRSAPSRHRRPRAIRFSSPPAGSSSWRAIRVRLFA
jgi:hypothetical protein